MAATCTFSLVVLFFSLLFLLLLPLLPVPKGKTAVGILIRVIMYCRYSALLVAVSGCLQCFDAVGWVAGTASGL